MSRGGSRWPARLLLLACLMAGPALSQECSAEKEENSIIDIDLSLPRGVRGAEPLRVPSAGACVRACCSGHRLAEDKKCNLIIFYAARASTHPNCYLFHCPSTEACPMKPATGLVSYRITTEDKSIKTENISSNEYSLPWHAGTFISHSQDLHQNHSASLDRSVLPQASELLSRIGEHLDSLELHPASPEPQRAKESEGLDPISRQQGIRVPPSKPSAAPLGNPTAAFPTPESSRAPVAARAGTPESSRAPVAALPAGTPESSRAPVAARAGTPESSRASVAARAGTPESSRAPVAALPAGTPESSRASLAALPAGTPESSRASLAAGAGTPESSRVSLAALPAGTPESSRASLAALPAGTAQLESLTTSLHAGAARPTPAASPPAAATAAKPAGPAAHHAPLSKPTNSTSPSTTTSSGSAPALAGLRTPATAPEPAVVTSSDSSHVTLLSFPGVVLSSDSPASSQNDPQGSEPSDSESSLSEGVVRGKGVFQLGEESSLVAALFFGVMFLLLVIVLTGRKIHESLQKRRRYTKLDYLINGIYADV